MLANFRLPTTLAKNCHTTINLLDKMEESRMLSPIELHLWTAVKLSLHRYNADLTTYWRQRAKIKDCVLGDENSAYLHVCASVRYRKNQIKSLELDGVSYTSQVDKERILLDFFKNLVGTVARASFSFDLPSLLVGSSLSTSQARDIVRPFMIEEIKLALWGMNDNASPGPDGFGPAFYKANWNLVKNDLLNLLNDFHSSKADLRRTNKAYIVLLPKKLGATQPENFRPVSLQNCAVKIASKCLANRAQYLYSTEHACEHDRF